MSLGVVGGAVLVREWGGWGRQGGGEARGGGGLGGGGLKERFGGSGGGEVGWSK